MSPARSSFVVGALCVAVACSSQPDSPTTSADAAVARAEAGASAAEAGANACLLEYQTRYDALLTLERAASAAKLPADQAKMAYSKALENPIYHQVSYSWPSDRVRVVTVSGREISAPRPDVVALGNIRPIGAEAFRQTYRAVTAEEARQVDEAIDESEEEALETAQQKTFAKGLTGMAAAMSQGYRDVASVGDAASFNTMDSTLHVLDRGVSFTIVADTSDDADANQATAVTIAQLVIDACS